MENAGWPALLVDSAGSIRASSQGARKIFGSAIESRPSLAQSIWSRENDLTPEEFLKTWRERTPDAPLELRFRGRDGSTCSYSAQVCPASLGDGDDLLLLQLFKVPPRPEEEEKPRESRPPVPETPPAATSESGSVMETGLAQKQKLDCAMQLIRTVALDFNNALTSIMGHASLLLAKVETRNPIRNSLVEIEKSAQRAAEIAHDLAAFSRQEKDVRAQQSGNVNDLLRRTIEVLKENQSETIHFKEQFASRPYALNFDEAKMQQAFVKILENSVQALGGFGTIYVKTENLDVADTFRDGSAKLPQGAYVCIEFTDTGCGIAPEVLPRIFEPFFTTKKEAGHRGLGLAWVYGIVTNHGGTVTVSSEVNRGTTVRIYLPAQKKVVNDEVVNSGDLTGTQTILMIDDEDLLLTMGEMILTSFGYKVITANNGLKALDIFLEKSADIDLVITDLVMPQMSGRELIERLRRISPGVKIICASGFVRPPSSEDDENYLQKPFASQSLLRKVKQVLGAIR